MLGVSRSVSAVMAALSAALASGRLEAQIPLTSGERERRATVLDALLDYRTEWQRAPTQWVGCSLERVFGAGVTTQMRPSFRALVARAPIRPDTGCSVTAYHAAGVRTIYVRQLQVAHPDSGRSIVEGVGWKRRPRYTVWLEITEGGCRTDVARVDLVPRGRRAMDSGDDAERWVDVRVVQSQLQETMALSDCACLTRACREPAPWISDPGV